MHTIILKFATTVCLCVCLDVAVCHDYQYHHHQSVWTQPLPRTTPDFGCVAIVTGYPEVSRLKPLVERLLHQLLNDFHVDMKSVHVFCQGKCGDAFPDLPFQYHELNNTVDRSKYRGFIIARNYKLMFKELFEELENTNYCLILEDDLVLSPDSFAYVEAGVELMRLDKSIFTVSLYNDNSYPWCSSNLTFFRRIDHFSGLGFIMSKQWYLELVKDNWDEEKVWDHNLQTIMAENKMASIQPEVNRVLHCSDTKITSTYESRPKYNQYLSQMISHEKEVTFHLKHLQKDAYEASISEFIKNAKVIDHLFDAAYYEVDIPLVHRECETERPCLSELLGAHGLRGAGLGHMVRGIYQGTLYIRIFRRLILIVIRNSPFWEDVSEVAMKDTIPNKTTTVEPRVQGLLHHLIRNYNIKTAQTDSASSCEAVCSAVGLECTRAGLWLLNMDCAVLQELVPECTQCQRNPTKITAAPYMGTEGLCMLGSSYALDCSSDRVPEGVRWLCPCHL